jgi:hypothetical protein
MKIVKEHIKEARQGVYPLKYIFPFRTEEVTTNTSDKGCIDFYYEDEERWVDYRWAPTKDNNTFFDGRVFRCGGGITTKFMPYKKLGYAKNIEEAKELVLEDYLKYKNTK